MTSGGSGSVLKRALPTRERGGGDNLRSHPPDFGVAGGCSAGLRKRRIGVLDV